MAELNDIAFFRGEAVALTFTMTPTTDITGWGIEFTLRNNANDASALLQVAGVLLTPGSGIFEILLTHAQTVGLLGNYAYDIQRTDGGSEAVLSIGTLTVSQEVLYP